MHLITTIFILTTFATSSPVITLRTTATKLIDDLKPSWQKWKQSLDDWRSSHDLHSPYIPIDYLNGFTGIQSQALQAYAKTAYELVMSGDLPRSDAETSISNFQKDLITTAKAHTMESNLVDETLTPKQKFERDTNSLQRTAISSLTVDLSSYFAPGQNEEGGRRGEAQTASDTGEYGLETQGDSENGCR